MLMLIVLMIITSSRLHHLQFFNFHPSPILLFILPLILPQYFHLSIYLFKNVMKLGQCCCYVVIFVVLLLSLCCYHFPSSISPVYILYISTFHDFSSLSFLYISSIYPLYLHFPGFLSLE